MKSRDSGYMLDDDRQKVREGDTVFFCYGIPPVRVAAPIIKRGKSLVALTPDHNPEECNLGRLRAHVGAWFKHSR